MPDINLKDFFGLREIDVLGLLYDYKKIISTGIQRVFLKNLLKTFIKYNLKFDALDSSFDYRKENKTYLISKKREYLKGVKKAYELKRFDIVGDYLGYPKCCVDFYHKQKKDSGYLVFRNFIKNIYNNSDKISWKLNNILNFEGRLNPNKQIYTKEFISFINKIGFISLISHSPCSYDCKKSLKIADLNLKYSFLHHCYLDELTILRKPILYIDDFHFIIFEGYSEESSIRYNKLLLCLGMERFKNHLLKGNQIKIDKESVFILMDERIIVDIKYKKQILILPFDKSL